MASATPISPETTTPTPPQIEMNAAAEDASVAAPRPTVLQLAPALDAAAAPTTSAASAAPCQGISPSASASSCGSISPSSCSAISLALSPSSSFLPEMPQWKRDLIQRRKSNVARTNAAGASPSPSPLSPSASASSDHAVDAAASADGFMKSPRKDFTLKTTTVYPAQHTATTTKVSNNNSSSGKHATSQQQQQQQQQQQENNSTTATEQQLQKNAKTNLTTTTTATTTKMPATTNSPTKSPTAALLSAISPIAARLPAPAPTKEKSEKCIGGHYTPLSSPQSPPPPPPLTAKDQNERIVVAGSSSLEQQRRGGDLREEQQLQQQSQQPLKLPTPLSPSKSTAPIPKQRSLFSCSTTTTSAAASAAAPTATTTNTAKSQTKEQQQQETAASLCSTTGAGIHNNTNTEKRGMQSTSTSPTTTSPTSPTTRLTSSATLRERGSGSASFEREHERNEFNEMHETETTRKPKSGTYANSSSAITSTSPTQSQQQQPQLRMQSTTKTNTATAAAAATTGAHATATASATPSCLSSSSPLQSHSNNESERTFANSSCNNNNNSNNNNNNNNNNHNNSNTNSNVAATLTLLDSSNNSGGSASACVSVPNEKTVIVNPAISCKISNKLQNNQFIKNQNSAALSSSASSSNKYSKYKTHSVQDCGTYAGSATAVTAATTATGSPTKSPSTTCAIKKKMVAVQEMKKTTQSPPNNSHHHAHHAHHHHVHHHRQQQQQQQQQAQQQQRRPSQIEEPSATGDFDASEDLSYGPGIVSKLRCRYLSLALRESMEKERHCLDNLRRATSLNNLLDRDEHHRNEEDDDDDEDDVEHEDDGNYGDAVIDTGIRNECANGVVAANGKFKAGILKPLSCSPQPSQDSSASSVSSSLVSKKTATFQKYAGANSAANSVSNGSARMSQSSTNGSATHANNSAAVARSRHFKRGNDSLKRARSVEALLCEKSPWNYARHRTSYDATNKQSGQNTPLSSTTTSSSSAVVTIEDKICNARERLILGTDTMPPKRLTSIIDDTERPPPDLVKQTLKMFEATANRRPRPNRANSKGDVASKVANYKSIIKENKPAIVFPKPTPTSPTKKLGSGSAASGAVRQQTTVKPMLVAADLIGSPIGRKATIAAAAGAVTPTLSLHADLQYASSTPKTSHKLAGSPAFLSEQSPDIIPRLNNKLLSEKNETAGVTDSPVTALTKKLEKLRIDTDKQQQAKPSSGGGGGGGVGGGIGIAATNNSSSNVTIKEFNAKQQQSKLTAESANNEVNNETTNIKFVGGDAAIAAAAAAAGGDDKNDRADAFVVSTGAAPSSSSLLLSSSSSASILAAATLGSVQAGTAASSSDLSDDEYGQSTPTTSTTTTKTKRITKSALDNIAKAGTTQQFKFAGTAAATATNSSSSSLHAKANLTSNAALHDSTHPNISQHTDIPTAVLQAVAPGGKQIGVIRPLTTTTTASAAAAAATTSNSNQQNNNSNNQQHSQQHHHMETLKQHANYTHTTSASSSLSSVSSVSSSSAAPPTQQQQQQQQQHTPPLTSREIEKNRINEMKKTALAEHTNASALTGAGGGVSSCSSSAAGAATVSGIVATSLDTVINTNTGKTAAGVAAAAVAVTSSPGAAASGFSELDASTSAASNSPLWALRKKRQPPAAVTENTSMVFNFSNRKEVPDYIENDGVIFRRKRELPKPNESGFVLLGDLSLETSTDSDYDDFSMCPPSPCDVEFENANIVIDGKSSIRQKSKEATFRVQFNDTLTSTFEYPSEASLIVDDSFNDHYANADDLVSAYENLMLEDPSVSPAHHYSHQHHHVAVDEIIQLPTTQNVNASPASNTATTTTNVTATKNILGNLPLDYPSLAKGIILQQQPQQQLQLQPPPQLKEKHEEQQLPPLPPQRPTNLPLPLTILAATEKPVLPPKRLKPATSQTTATVRAATTTTTRATATHEVLKTTTALVQQQKQRIEYKTNDAAKPLAAANFKPLRTRLMQPPPQPNEPPPPMIPKFQPRILQDFQLASFKPTTTTTTTNAKNITRSTKIKTTTTTTSNITSNMSVQATVTTATATNHRKMPAVLNKPQYACFLKNDFDSKLSSSTSSRIILRSRSNEFQIHNSNSNSNSNSNHNSNHNSNSNYTKNGLSVFKTSSPSTSAASGCFGRSSAAGSHATVGRGLNATPTSSNPIKQQQPLRSASFSFGSAPLGFYSPVKAPIDNLFQLGVTRAPNGNGHAYNATMSPSTAGATATTTTTNGNGNFNGVVAAAAGGGGGLSSIVGIGDGLINGGGGGSGGDEPESLQYLKPANDDLTIAYSEGATKTDLLY